MVKYIELTRGQIAKVDDQDFHLVKDYSWRMNPGGYAQVTIYNQPTKSGRNGLLMHRLILGAQKGERVEFLTDDKLDCRRENIRIRDNKKA